MAVEMRVNTYARPSRDRARTSAEILRRFLAVHPALPTELRPKALPDAIAELEHAGRRGSNGAG